MHPEELASAGLAHDRTTPVRVRGFRRSFCQEPSWRVAASRERGVLTVRPSGGDWINGVLVHGCDEAVLEALDHRERGYVREDVPSGRLEPYGSIPRSGAHRAALYLGRDEMFNSEILPGQEYLEICVGAAAAYGKDFLQDFLRSTYVADRTPLIRHQPELARRFGSMAC